MRRQVCTCDRCGREQDEHSCAFVAFTLTGVTRHFDLCPECSISFTHGFLLEILGRAKNEGGG